VAFEYTGALAEPARLQSEGGLSMPRTQKPSNGIELQVRKPSGRSGH
jgi:hypothetical protein